MSGWHEIAEAARRAQQRDEDAVLATVVQVAGSAYRRPGARMLFAGSEGPVGLVSGGCLEGDLAERAAEVSQSGAARTAVYDMRSPDDIVWGLGLGCDGEIRVLLEPVPAAAAPAYFGFVERSLASRDGGVLVTLYEVEGALDAAPGERLCLDQHAVVWHGIAEPALRELIITDARAVLATGQSVNRRYALAEGSAAVLIEFVAPRVALCVFGAGADARPLVRMAAGLGWSVRVFDHRPAYARSSRFPDAESVTQIEPDTPVLPDATLDQRTPVVVMTHHFLHDLALLRMLLGSPAPYVGVIGPRKRAERLLAELTSAGSRPTADQLARLHGPVGLDVGSESPEEIALSILAEILAVLNRREGGFLKHRQAPLHDWPR